MRLPCRAPGQEVPKGGKSHFLLRFSRDPAASWLSGVLVLPRGSQRPSATCSLRRAGGPSCSEPTPFLSEADDSPRKGKGELGETSGSFPSSPGCLTICVRVGSWSATEGYWRQPLISTEDESDLSLTL